MVKIKSKIKKDIAIKLNNEKFILKNGIQEISKEKFNLLLDNKEFSKYLNNKFIKFMVNKKLSESYKKNDLFQSLLKNHVIKIEIPKKEDSKE